MSLVAIVLGLGLCVWPIEEKSHYFLERFFADIYGAVYPIGWFYPINLADNDIPRLSFLAVAEFDSQQVATQYDRDPMKRIAMPGRGFPRR